MIELSAVPENPGCYIYKDEDGKIIYVGKAKNLRKRVSSYFQKKELDPKTRALVSRIKDIDFIVTNSEAESLILENTLIKKHKPKYNIDLKDSKTYAYIELTNEKYPRLMIARRKDDSGKFYGPFVSGKERDYILYAINRIFQLRTCRRIPKKACLRYHIGLCTAPCINLISEDDYNKNISKAKLVLSGKTDELIEKLKSEILILSKNQEYEKAIEARNQIASLSRLGESQNMARERKGNEDILNYLVRNNKVYLMLFKIYKGTLAEKQEFTFEFYDGFLEEFIAQYYSENEIPEELILPGIDEEIRASIESFLNLKKEETKNEKNENNETNIKNVKNVKNEIHAKKVKAIIPQQGSKKELLLLVKKNIEISFFGDTNKVEALKEALHLSDAPSVIECFDISHLSGTAMVGSMVQFRNGRADKSNYRRFMIKTVDKIDDFASIAEIVKRRYLRLQKEGSEMPSLIVIDGGKGQLSAAFSELRKLNLKLPLISIAKRLEEIYMPGFEKPFVLDRHGTALRFVQEIRDEAHRFAITYNRLKRSKSLIE
jgi:excinuclease ABC subunit C